MVEPKPYAIKEGGGDSFLKEFQSYKYKIKNESK